MPSTPKDAAAIILLKDAEDPKVFWVKRSPKLAFMGGYHAFPGGQLDEADLTTPVAGSASAEEAAMQACAVRELFEEAGVLLAHPAEGPSRQSLEEMREALNAGHKGFSQLLEESGLQLDASMLIPVGRWVTPPFSPRRFDTWFFLAWLPAGQEASVKPGELELGEWIRASEALARWQQGEVIMAPPTLHALRTLARHKADDTLPSAFTSIPEARRGIVRRIEFGPGMFFFPVKTPTLPPATHTNCYVIGGEEMIVIDPASIYPEEQHELDVFIDGLLAEGRRIREIFLTHHHRDHVGGSDHLRQRLGVKVAAHRLTAERLGSSVTVDRFVEDNELIDLPGAPGWKLRALHTPGHTRGHLCFYEELTGIVFTGDLVVGLGTVVIDPPEGNMARYMESLRRLLALPKLASLFPAHGPAIGSAKLKIEEYIEHRGAREQRILQAVLSGAETPESIVPLAYTDVSPALYGLAERSTVAHLEKLVEDGSVIYDGKGLYRAG
jgi:ribonuclease/clavin/mitogillin